MTQNPDEDEKILFIENAPLPAPLDPHIASVALGSPDNSAVGGYDLFMSAVVGCDHVTLLADKEPLDLEISVNQAEIRLDFVRCRAQWGRDYERLFFDEKMSIEFQNSSNLTAGASANLLSGSFSADAKTNKQQMIGGSKSALDFVHTPLELIRIGNWRKKITETHQPLQRYFGWRVEHNEDALNSGVLARLRVKKNWLDITQIDASHNTSLSRYVRDLMSPKNQSTQKAKLFKKLVKELIFLRLQKSDDDGLATLSASGVTVSQQQEMSLLMAPETPLKINVSANLLMRFLTSKEGSETDTYNEILLTENEKQRIDSKQFVPQASYTETLNAFCDLAAIYRETSEITEYGAVKERYSENVMQELSSLGVIRRRKKAYHFVNPFPGIDFILAFESIVRSQQTIIKTIEILASNPSISNVELGDELNTFLNRKWKESSKTRSGMQLKNWARFRGMATKKRQYAIPDDAVPLLLEMNKQGKSHKEIAKHFNVVPVTVSKRLKMLIDKGET